MAEVPTADHLLGQTIDGKIQIVSLLGSGGMGSVYKAEHLALGRAVAVKILPANISPDSALFKRFQLEASHLKNLSHPNIVSVLSFGIVPQGGRPFLVLEYLGGGSLSQYIARTGGLALSACWTVFEQIGAGLSEAHKQRILHRDMKPSNIMFAAAPDSAMDENTQIKIVDFGISKLLDAETIQKLTQTGSLLGTPLYMSPEQLAGIPPAPSSDIYSLGCLMHECLFGRTPFSGDSAIQIATSQMSSDIVVPVETAKGETVPMALRSLIASCLEKNPAKRILDGATFCELLALAKAAPHLVPAGLKAAATRQSTHSQFKIPTTRHLVFCVAVVATICIVSFSIMTNKTAEDANLRKRIGSAWQAKREPVPDWAQVRRSLEKVVDADSKNPAIISSLNEVLLASLNLHVERNNGQSDDSIWIFRQCTKIPAGDATGQSRLFTAYSRLASNAGRYYAAKPRPEYLDDVANYRKQLPGLLRANPNPNRIELSFGLEGLRIGGGQLMQLFNTTSDPKKKQHLLRTAIDWLRTVVEMRDQYPPRNREEREIAQMAVRDYASAALIDDDSTIAELEQFLAKLVRTPAWNGKSEEVNEIWYEPTLYYCVTQLRQHKNYAEVERLLQPVKTKLEEQHFHPPDEPEVLLHLTGAQLRQKKLDLALVNALAATNAARRLPTPNPVLIAECELYTMATYNDKGDYLSAKRHAKLAVDLLQRANNLPGNEGKLQAKLDQALNSYEQLSNKVEVLKLH